jgi:predicted aspartyl protease
MHSLLLAVLLGAPQVVAVPIEVEDERLYVPVEVGGLTRSMVLDTGVSSTILDTDTAAALGLDAGQLQPLTGVGTRTSTVGAVNSLRLLVGAVPLDARSPRVVPIDATLSAYTGRHVPGIIGAQFFGEHTVTIDFSARRMEVGPVGTSEVPPGAIAVPITVEGGIPFAMATLETAGGERVSMRVLVDLGAKATLLVTEPFLARSGLSARAGPAVRSLLGAGVGGPTRYDFVRAGELRLGGAAVKAPVVGLSVGGTLRSADYDALLGLRFLRRFKVTFDYARSRLVLVPGPDVAEPETFDASGLYLCARGDGLRRFEVEEVAPGSPADQAGLVRGDVVVEVNGAPIGATTLAALRRTLSGEPGTKVRLGLRRRAGPVLATLTLRPRLP